MVVCLPKNNHCHFCTLYSHLHFYLSLVLFFLWISVSFRCFVMKFSVLDVSSKMSQTTFYVHNCSKLENSS